MLTKRDKPIRTKAQPSIKTSACKKCRAPVKSTTRPKLYCAECSAERKLASSRVAMEKQRRKRGIAKVKGVVAKCDRCQRDFVRRSFKHRFCDECAPKVALERANKTATAKRRAAGMEPLGKIHKCANCPNNFVKQTSHEIYCAECKEISKAGMLPKAREWKREYGKRVLRPQYHNDPIVNAKEKRRQVDLRLRRKKLPSFTINERMSAGIRLSLKGKKNGASWEALVGYSLDDLMRHLERQFLPGMTWENRGKWHTDHIIPLSSFKFDSAEHPEFRAAWALTNLAPLWAEDNLAKRAHRIYLL